MDAWVATGGQPRGLAYVQPLKRDLRLLQVDENTLNDILSGRACLKGTSHGEAVLCTSTTTLSIKTVETTNTLLLLPPEQEPASGCAQPLSPANLNAANNTALRTGVGVGLMTQLQQDSSTQPALQVTAAASNTLETQRVAPNLELLDLLLQEQPLTADEAVHGMDADVNSKGWAFDELLQQIQASEQELRDSLAARHAIQLQGKWRVVDDGCWDAVLELLLAEGQVQGWQQADSSWHIPVDAATAALQEHVEPRLVEHCLHVFSHGALSPEHSPPAQRDRHVVLDKRKVCQQAALKLLRQQAQWSWEAFHQAWRVALPEGFEPHKDMLRGEALVCEGAEGQRVKRFRVSDLPQDAAARFAVLFAERPAWLWEDLEPYVAVLAVRHMRYRAVRKAAQLQLLVHSLEVDKGT